MIKVVHIIGSLEKGGAEQILKNLIETQSGLVEHVVITLSLSGKERNELEAKGFRVFEIVLRQKRIDARYLFGMCRFIGGSIRIIRTIRSEKPDIVQTWMYHSDLIGGVAGKLLGIPVIWGIFLSNLSPNYYKRSTYLLIRLLGLLSSIIPQQIISCTETGVETHRRVGYPRQKMMVIPVGFNTSQYKYSRDKRILLRRQVKTSPETTVIGMVARWDPQKDFVSFYQAASKLSQERGDVQFWLAGGYGITESNEKLMKLERENELVGKVKYFGEIDDIVAFYSSLDMFTLTSYGEGFPNVVGEAMSCQLPCVASNVGDLPMMLDPTVGELIDVNDPSQLLDRWRYLIDCGPERRKNMGRNARRTICRKYDIQKISMNYMKVYESVSNRSVKKRQNEETSDHLL